MKTAIGRVLGVAQRKDNFGILMGTIWYNGKGESPVNKGDQVSFEYEEVEKDGKTFRNIKKFTDAKIVPFGGQKPQTFNGEKDEKMARMSALKAITTILATNMDMSVLEKINESEKYAGRWSKWILTGGWE